MNCKVFIWASVVFSAALPIQAKADDASATTIDAEIGLSPVLSLSCTPIHFGNWRIPERDNSRGKTTVTLQRTDKTVAVLAGDTNQVARASRFGVPTAGECKVTGSTVIGGNISVNISSNTEISVMANGASHGGKAPAQLLAMKIDLALQSDSVVIDDSGSSSTFYIIGTLTIPAQVRQTNYGGYQTVSKATISITDTPTQ